MKCFRNASHLSSQMMGNLPSAHITQARVFPKVGVDLAFFFLIKPRKGPGVKPFKRYVCLYVCSITKAIHLKLVTDLKTETFLASLNDLWVDVESLWKYFQIEVQIL